MRTPIQAVIDLRVYLEQTVPRRLAAKRRERRRLEHGVYEQVRRDLARILAEVPLGLLERERLDPDARRREINAVYCAAHSELPESVIRELWALRGRLIRELRGDEPKAAAPVPRSSGGLLT